MENSSITRWTTKAMLGTFIYVFKVFRSLGEQDFHVIKC